MKPLSQIISELFSFLLKASVFLLIVLPLKLAFSKQEEPDPEDDLIHGYNWKHHPDNIWHDK
ncbi:MAG: hypothetical protein IBX55_10575 [Methyloprofundus sp.]|nr:hypothetical protein [Methyloprofundus sp.]